ncbi:ATP-binding protein [Mucilaginibacter sp. CSA2-8R]|uniref:ATP-binding protein n=1 Tax=Mucilaginibacter sp. CSA2-8R TaxID=3141542 RepID=UPI00315D1B3A
MDTTESQMFKALFHQSASPVSVVKANAPHFTVVAVNNLYKSTSQVPVEDIIGKPAFEVYKPWDAASAEQFLRLRRGMEDAVAKHEAVELPILMFDAPAADGKPSERSWWQITIAPITDSSGQLQFLKCITLNVSERERVKLEIQAAREKEHQLNEEMQAINEELASTNEELMTTIEELRVSQEKLAQLNNELEERVTARTAQLAASERRYRNMLNALPQIAWTTNTKPEVTFYNERWYEYTGLSVQQTQLLGWREVIHPDDWQNCVDTYRTIINSNLPGEFEVREKGADGIYRWHLLRIQPVRNEFGINDLWIGTATDIDEIKRLQQQKDDFISIASHELKTPITSLKASLQLMDKMKDDPSKTMMPKLILQSRKSIQRVSTLIEDLLNVSRLQQTQITLNKTNFILSQLLSACANPIAILGKQKVNITGDVELEICADEHRIDQVVTNLVNNAVKYAPDSECITLHIEQCDSMVKVSVIDKGPGIPPDKIPHLFNRYYRVESSSYHISGLGLGLYISAEIIKQHGGEIGADSKPGQGSTFWFTLPLCD